MPECHGIGQPRQACRPDADGCGYASATAAHHLQASSAQHRHQAAASLISSSRCGSDRALEQGQQCVGQHKQTAKARDSRRGCARTFQGARQPQCQRGVATHDHHAGQIQSGPDDHAKSGSSPSPDCAVSYLFESDGYGRKQLTQLAVGFGMQCEAQSATYGEPHEPHATTQCG